MSLAARQSRNLSHVTFSSNVSSGSPTSLPSQCSSNLAGNTSAVSIAGSSNIQPSCLSNVIHLSVTGPNHQPQTSNVTNNNSSSNAAGNTSEEANSISNVKNIAWYSKAKSRTAELPAKSANEYIWKKLETIVERMQDESSGVPIRTVKSLMSTVPSVFTGTDLISWVLKHLSASDCAEACHLASMIASMGYICPVVDHLLAVRNDAHALYRFQTPCLYPSRCVEADNIEYAVYLCKRTMQNKQRLELADFEAERLATLQSFYWHKWEFIYLQAEAEAKVDKKREKVERLVLESQEKGFWDASRPLSGAVNNNDLDMRKLCRAKRPKRTGGRPSWLPVATGPGGVLLWSPVESACTMPERLARFKACEEKKRVRVSKACESLHAYHDLYFEYDLLLLTSLSSSNEYNNATLLQSSAISGCNDPTIPLNTDIGNQAPTPNLSAVALVNTGTVATATATTTSSTAIGSNTAAMTTSITSTTNNYNFNMASSTNMTGVATSAGQSNNATNNSNNESLTSLVNPWICDNPEFWNQELTLKDVSARRVRRWGFSIHELLKDPAGREEIQKWLEKEFSAENLKFWEACQELKGAPLREISTRVDVIYNQFLAPNAAEPINVDSRVTELVRQRIGRSSTLANSSERRYCFEEAEEHIFKLMTSDSYYRFLRSNIYKEMVAGQKKKSKRKFPADIKQRLEIE